MHGPGWTDLPIACTVSTDGARLRRGRRLVMGGGLGARVIARRLERWIHLVRTQLAATAPARVRLAIGEDLTLGTLLDRVADARGDGVAHVADAALGYQGLAGPEITRRAARDWVARASAALVAEGVAPGDRVLLLCPNRLDALYAMLAVARAGAVAVPLHALATAEDLRSIAALTRARAALVDPEIMRTLDGRSAAPGVVRWIFLGPDRDVPSGELSLDRAAALRDGAGAAVPRSPDDVAVQLYTSGTTGQAKGAQLSSRSLLAVARLFVLPDRWLLRHESVVEGLPIAHVMGLVVHLAALAAGVPVRHLTRFDAGRALQLLAATRATVFVGVPAMYRAMAEADPEAHDLRSVRLWVAGADAMPTELVPRFKALGGSVGGLFGSRPIAEAFFVEFYGAVELSGAALIRVSPPGLDPEGGFLGFPLPGFSTRVAGDDGQEARGGEVGELWVKGPGVMRGYAGDPSAAPSTSDGWLRTGDLARRESFGLVRFVGRAKDVLKVAGYTVSPDDVEASLAGHPAVQRAVAFGLRDQTKGEVPALAVVLAPGAVVTPGELLAHAAAHAAAYKRPRAVFLVTAEELPVTSTQKVQRRVLADRFSSPAP